MWRKWKLVRYQQRVKKVLCLMFRLRLVSCLYLCSFRLMQISVSSSVVSNQLFVWCGCLWCIVCIVSVVSQLELSRVMVSNRFQWLFSCFWLVWNSFGCQVWVLVNVSSSRLNMLSLVRMKNYIVRLLGRCCLMVLGDMEIDDVYQCCYCCWVV